MLPALLNKSQLTPARRAIVELLQRINFGIIHNLKVENRQPVLNPEPTVIREIKLAAENGPRSEYHTPNFRLKPQWIELFELFDSLGTGVIESLEFKNGIPFKVMVADSQF
jgi:hypothetical protein